MESHAAEKITLLLVICVSSVFQSSEAIAGGTVREPCDFPGLAAVEVESIGLVFCQGVVEGTSLLIPQACYNILLLQTGTSEIVIHYGDGTQTFEIGKYGLKGALENGVYRMDVTGIEKTGVCSPDATPFQADTDSIDPESCELAGYGSATPVATPFTGEVKAAKVSKSTSGACCERILATYSESEQGPLNNIKPRNCLTSDGSPCGVADLGAPIYCTNDKGQKVVIGLTSSVPCKPGSVFTAHDLTGNSIKAKFGIPQ